MRNSLQLFICALLLWSVPASATLIEFSATNIVGTTWQFDYTVTNDTLDFDIEEFTIYFAVDLYANLATVATEPPGWDSLVIQPDPGLPDDGFYDSLALGAGIAPGESLGGFSLMVDYLGSGLPILQQWEVVDPLNFATLESGTSSGTYIGIAEPATHWLLLPGFIAAFAVRRRARRA